MNFSRRGSFSKESQNQKLIQQLRATQTRLSRLGCVSSVLRTSVRILQQARMDFSRSEKHPPRLVSRAAISPQDSLPSMAFLMVRKYFSCSRQARLSSLNCSSLGSQCARAPSSKRQWQLGDFFMILSAIFSTVHWNFMMKQMKISSLFFEMLNSFRIFQNYFVIQLAIELTARRYSTKRRTSPTFGANTRESQISRQEARSLSSQTRQREMSLARVGSVSAGSSMNLPSVSFLMRRRVLCGLESRKGCTPKASRQAMQPAAQTSHLEEQPSFLSCSGEAQRKVPLSSEKLSTFDMSSGPTIFAHPKSPIFTTRPFPSRMFYGFRSRWITPRTDITRKALRICLKISMISVVGRVLACWKQWLRSPSSQYSMMICISSSSSSKWYSQTRTRLGCVNFFMSSISSSACSTWNGSTLIFFSANDSSASLRTRQTQPKLPQPIMCIALQDCITDSIMGSRLMDAGIRFLVATDVHLGHRQKHPVRQEDSYKGFEDVIAHAKEQEVDFLLLGGDLFDEVNPSKECFFKCLTILKENIFGSRPPGLHVSLNGHPYRTNFEDPDLHISLPIFTIHGNHDYPTNEFGKISACDLLQASNYVNYFGKHLDLRNITIKPLIIAKRNSTARIALYGLGYIKDQILNELFEEKKVAFEQPEGGLAGCLCLFVFHQNRYKKGFKAGTPIHQSFNPRNIPEWMSLVIWGHEHEAIYKLEEECGRPVYQPGSTVLTSYIESESYKKQCLLVTALPAGKFELASLLLERSYRPMRCLAFEYQLLLAEFGADFDLFPFLEEQVLKALGEVGGTRKPIVRIKVEVTGLEETVRARQVETRFADRVANGEKILQFWRRKVEQKPKIDDNEMLSRLKNRQPLRSHSSIADELDGILRQHFDKVSTAVLPKEALVEVVSYLGRTDNTNAADIIRKKCEEMERHKTQRAAEELATMGREKQEEFKRTLKYYMDRKEYFSSGKINRTLYPNCSTPEEFLAYKNTLITENKFVLNCKMMEEKVEEPLSALPPNSGPSEASSKAHSHPSSAHSAHSSRPKKEERDSSVEIVERSDSEDCCSRAERTQFDETGNKLRYVEAQEKMKANNIAKSKRSALANSKQELKSEQKSLKQVRFSDNSRKIDHDFM